MPRPARASRNVFLVQPRGNAIKAKTVATENLNAIQCRGFAFIDPVRAYGLRKVQLWLSSVTVRREFQNDLGFLI